MIPLEWISPVYPSTASRADEEKVLSSFPELYKKTQATLYPSSQEVPTTSTANSNPQDKSPKGSVDAPIQSLVDLINRHYAICTLSSCSGRISLFDPNHQPSEAEQFSEEPTPENPFTEASGKGRGRWVLVTHDRLHRPDDLVEALFQPTEPVENSSTATSLPWILKFEPMLLHVAARSLIVGQALLQLALECGFRESGLVVTSKRVTVAIRSHSLSLAVPLQPPSHVNGQTIANSLTPTPSYLRALAEECNSRMLSNWKHLQRLYLALESKWFQVAFTPEKPLVANVEPLPSLQLWSAATVPVSTIGASETTASNGEMLAIYALGGYGRGPEQRDHSRSNASSQRSSSIYRLCRSANEGVWANEWERVELTSNDNAGEIPNVANVATITAIPACQGVAGANFWNHWILYWGGRASPTEPLDPHQLWMLDTTSNSLWNVSVASECPPARWGHSLLPLSNSRWLLVGGSRVFMDSSSTNNLPALEDLYILHYLPEERSFVWEKLPNTSTRLEGGRMHAAASIMNSPGDDLWDILGCADGETDQTNPNDACDQWVLVQGGLDRTAQSNPLLSCKPPLGANSSGIQKQGDRSLFRIGKTTKNGEGVLTTDCSTLSIDQKDQSGPTHGWFGGSSCLLWSDRVLLTTGGIGGSDGNADASPVSASMLSNQQQGSDSSSMRWSPVPLHLQVAPSNSPDAELDFGSMVHHSCIKVSDTQLASVGGGVSSFAFGELFSLSYLITLVSPQEASSGTLSSNTVTPNNRHSSATSKNDDSKSSSQQQQPNRTTTRVVYVEPANAKRVKTELERRNWLDKGYRMIPVPSPADTNAKRIAIPLTETAQWPLPPSSSSDGWESCILDHGMEELPWSTARYAKK